jgi:hypothetical protein
MARTCDAYQACLRSWTTTAYLVYSKSLYPFRGAPDAFQIAPVGKLSLNPSRQPWCQAGCSKISVRREGERACQRQQVIPMSFQGLFTLRRYANKLHSRISKLTVYSPALSHPAHWSGERLAGRLPSRLLQLYVTLQLRCNYAIVEPPSNLNHSRNQAQHLLKMLKSKTDSFTPQRRIMFSLISTQQNISLSPRMLQFLATHRIPLDRKAFCSPSSSSNLFWATSE